jgi:hypothetical protein
MQMLPRCEDASVSNAPVRSQFERLLNEQIEKVKQRFTVRAVADVARVQHNAHLPLLLLRLRHECAQRRHVESTAQAVIAAVNESAITSWFGTRHDDDGIADDSAAASAAATDNDVGAGAGSEEADKKRTAVQVCARTRCSSSANTRTTQGRAALREAWLRLTLARAGEVSTPNDDQSEPAKNVCRV